MSVRVATCIGTGTIGASWAICFARSVDRVMLYDKNPAAVEQGLSLIRRSLSSLEAAGAVGNVAETMGRIHVAASLEEAVAESGYVQESIIERRDIKRDLFAELDELVPDDCILASSTSEIPPYEFMGGLKGRSRCLVVHPLNPPHLIPAVEICPAEFTSAETVEETRTFMKAVGQKPLVVNKEVKGFVMNRLQLAVIRESLHLVEQGICDVEGVDVAMKYGLGLRWATMGPFETNFLSTTGGDSHFLSPEGYYATLKNIADDLSSEFEFETGLGQKIDAELKEMLVDVDHDAAAEKRDRNLIKICKNVN